MNGVEDRLDQTRQAVEAGFCVHMKPAFAHDSSKSYPAGTSQLRPSPVGVIQRLLMQFSSFLASAHETFALLATQRDIL